jgi:hypothetical protein
MKEMEIQYKGTEHHIRKLWTRVSYSEGPGFKSWKSRHFLSLMITNKNTINARTLEVDDTTIPSKLVLHTTAHPTANPPPPNGEALSEIEQNNGVALYANLKYCDTENINKVSIYARILK